MELNLTELFTLDHKISSFLDSNDQVLNINSITFEQWRLLSSQVIGKLNNIFIFENYDLAEAAFSSDIGSNKRSFYYPGIESFSLATLPSEANLFKRFSVLSEVSSSVEKVDIYTSIEALNLYIPDADFFTSKCFNISVDDIISPSELAQKLVAIGYINTESSEESGSFSNKGEVFDIFPVNSAPIRLLYFDDLIESIFYIDEKTLRTLRDANLQTVRFYPTPRIITNSEFTNNFRTNNPRPKLNFKNALDSRELYLEKLNSNYLFQEYPLFFSSFFSKTTTLKLFRDDFTLHYIDHFKSTEKYNANLEQAHQLFGDSLENSQSEFMPNPSQIFSIEKVLNDKSFLLNELLIHSDFNTDFKNTIDFNLKSFSHLVQYTNLSDKLVNTIDFIKKHVSDNKCILFYNNENSLKEINFLLEKYQCPLNNILFKNSYLGSGFLYENEKLLFVSESDFFGKRNIQKKKAKRSRQNDLFADQLATLKVGDYIIHKDYGVGAYEGIQSLDFGGTSSDYITLKYSDDDKIYVPVYKLDLLQKHASKNTTVRVASLKSKKFDREKVKARESVKKLAFDLLELQAKRELKEGYSFSSNSHEFTEFELTFPFEETPDQKFAIEDVLSDMESLRPMDRLVCGDVGFGKTEVAIRAAYKAVLDGKQVSILVPTTVLAFQHYNSFIQRFKNFPVNIEFISRFKTAKEVKEILLRLELGQVDIIIGTHKLLSDKVKFKDLGLIVIDEEQRFGVAHKEKLKLMREAIDTLTLTATPIPRTLQMSFFGIKDLSLIKTPPVRRQSIKSYIIRDDKETLKSAINQELSRGGQVFIVHNKVKDIEVYTSKIRELAPKARIVYAHGQLPEKELEKRISDFYGHKFDILISTTIIESGIDIPSANTMIIDRADTFGLSQLHQLRGRIGRSDKKAYAYFIIPPLSTLSDIAQKRLKAIQAYADIGAGFSLATNDLEIRGSGDILGPEQSGHIGSVGLELYMELLKEAVAEIKGQPITEYKNIEISTPFNTSIPEVYIRNTGTRLKLYKTFSSFTDLASIEEKSLEVTDMYGAPPENFNNLVNILKIRVILKDIGISSFKVKSKRINIHFDKDAILKDDKLQSKIIAFFSARPKVYKLNPDYSVICSFKERIDLPTVYDFAKNIAEQI